MSIDYSKSASETDGDFRTVFLLACKKPKVDEPSNVADLARSKD